MEHGRRAVGGFTLMEMMAGLAAVGVLLTVGLPSVERYHTATRRTETSMNLLSALQHARLDAVNHGTTVSICGQGAGTAKSQCDLTDSAQWSNGWMTFSQDDGDAQQRILATQEALDPGVVVAANFSGKPVVSFDASGQAGQNISFTICDQSGQGHGSQVRVSIGGQISMYEFSGCTGSV